MRSVIFQLTRPQKFSSTTCRQPLITTEQLSKLSKTYLGFLSWYFKPAADFWLFPFQSSKISTCYLVETILSNHNLCAQLTLLYFEGFGDPLHFDFSILGFVTLCCEKVRKFYCQNVICSGEWPRCLWHLWCKPKPKPVSCEWESLNQDTVS